MGAYFKPSSLLTDGAALVTYILKRIPLSLVPAGAALPISETKLVKTNVFQ